MVYIDIEARTLNVDVSEEEFARRKGKLEAYCQARHRVAAAFPKTVYLCTPRRYRLLG